MTSSARLVLRNRRQGCSVPVIRDYIGDLAREMDISVFGEETVFLTQDKESYLEAIAVGAGNGNLVFWRRLDKEGFVEGVDRLNRGALL